MKNLIKCSFTIIFTMFCFNVYSYENFEVVEQKGFFPCYNFFEECEITEQNGFVPVSKDFLGPEKWIENSLQECNSQNIQQYKQDAWRLYYSHLAAAEANMRAAEKQSLLIPDSVSRQIMSAAIKTCIASMQGADLRTKIILVSTLLVEQYLECILDNYEKIEMYLKAAQDQFELALRYLDIVSA